MSTNLQDNMKLNLIHHLESGIWVFGGRFPEAVLAQIETCREVAVAIEKYIGKSAKSQVNVVRQEPGYPAAAEAVPEEICDFRQWPEYRKLKDTMDRLTASGLPNPPPGQYRKQGTR